MAALIDSLIIVRNKLWWTIATIGSLTRHLVCIRDVVRDRQEPGKWVGVCVTKPSGLALPYLTCRCVGGPNLGAASVTVFALSR